MRDYNYHHQPSAAPLISCCQRCCSSLLLYIPVNINLENIAGNIYLWEMREEDTRRGHTKTDDWHVEKA